MTGVVAARGGDRWWAWAASEVTPADSPPSDDGTKTRTALPIGSAATNNEFSGTADTVVQAGQVYGGLHIHDGRRLPPDDSAWLRSIWEPVAAAGAAVEIRYLTRPDGLDAFLVVRAEAADRAEAEHRVVALRDRLNELPGHVTAAPVTEAAETHRILEPFQPHGEGIVEIRKRLTVQRTSRDDANHPWLAAVTPLTYQRQSWDPLWTELTRLPSQAMLSIALAPYPIGSGLRSHLTARAANLARLARPGPSPTAVWRVPRQPDSAVDDARTR